MPCAEDCRLGGVPEYYVGERDLMRVPDEVLKCVAFVGHKTGDTDSIRICGTAFFFSVPGDDPDRPSLYVVTARHVIEKIERQHHGDLKVRIRVNTRSGGSFDVVYDVDEWQYHPTDKSSVDIAVCRWVAPVNADFRFVPFRMALTEKKVKDKQIGAGDDIFLTGMFKGYKGGARNEPIIRSGTIAMMPSDPVSVGGSVGPAYLIETRSIGGLSGCPVFVSLWPGRVAGGRIKQTAPEMHLLGLVSGHFDVAAPEGHEPDPDDERLNSGISVVAKASKLIEIIELGFTPPAHLG